MRMVDLIGVIGWILPAIPNPQQHPKVGMQYHGMWGNVRFWLYRWIKYEIMMMT
jgi:hypothetical protein